MSLSINTNIASLNAQFNLKGSQKGLNQALERLSSGKRINSAADDAAGLAITLRMTTRERGLTQATRNANDGVSLAQTAEGYLGQLDSSLQRMRELAVQSVNATNSSQDRASLNEEFQQLLKEVSDVSVRANFNGRKLFDGNFGIATFQVGSQVHETVKVRLSDFRPDQAGLYALGDSTVATTYTATTANVFVTGGTTVGGAGNGGTAGTDIGVSNAALTNNQLSVNGRNIQASQNLSSTGAGRTADSAFAKAKAINDAQIDGVNAQATPAQYIAATTNGISVAGGEAGDTVNLAINGTTVTTLTIGGTVARTVDELVTDINAVSDQTNVFATRNDAGQLVLTNDEGGNIAVTMTTTDADGGAEADKTITSFAGVGAAVAAVTSTFTTRGGIELQSNDPIVIADAAAGGSAAIGYTVGTITANSNPLSSLNINDVDNSNSAIFSIDSAINTLANQRAELGAVQSRFEATINNSLAEVQQLIGAKSRILDADFAAESAELTKNQILQQAGIAILAQSNSLSQGVLSLLQ